MNAGALESLLERRVERDSSTPVDRVTIGEWCAVFGGAWPECVGDVAPAVMFTTFVRPLMPPTIGEVAPTGVVLHDDLKVLLGLPVAIATGYELKVLGDVRVGDQLVSVERIAELGEERETKLGRGRNWVIEVSTSTLDGTPVGVERFRMLGYQPGTSGTPTSRTDETRVDPEWSDEISIDEHFIIAAATANHVWAPAHHVREAARAAGLVDIILDTSSQVALFAGSAQRRRPHQRIRSVELSMKRPILPGVTVTMSGVSDSDSSSISASVDGREVSRALISFSG